MSLGLFSTLVAAYFKGPGPIRIALPALFTAGTALVARPIGGDRAAILREAGPEIFPVACAAFLISSAIIGVRTGAGKAARTPLYSDRELMQAGLTPLGQTTERLLFHGLYSLLLVSYALPPLLWAGIISGLGAESLPHILSLLFLWTLCACAGGALGNALFAGWTLLPAAVPLSLISLLLIYRDEADRSLSPLLSLQELSGARFFTGVPPDPLGMILSLGGLILLCYAGVILRLRLSTREGGGR